jgi:hypothetical protein
MDVLFLFSLRDPPGDVSRKPIKKPQPEMRVEVRVVRAAALPVGPSLDQRRSVSGGADRPLLYKRRANSLARKNPFGINRKKLIAAFRSTADCRRSLH